MDTPLMMMDTAGDREVGAGYAEAITGEGLPPRRQYPVEVKRRIVEETFAPGASVSVVARRHDVNANQVFEWRKQYRKGRLFHQPAAPKACAREGMGAALRGHDLIRVGVIDHEGGLRPAACESLPPPSSPPPREVPMLPPGRAAPAGRIEIELPNGLKVRVEGEVGERALTEALVAAKELVI